MAAGLRGKEYMGMALAVWLRAVLEDAGRAFMADPSDVFFFCGVILSSGLAFGDFINGRSSRYSASTTYEVRICSK